MEKNASGNLVLKKGHAYYYLMQLQMSSADYCDFAVWREDNIILKRILYCITDALDRIPIFVKAPELVGKYFKNPFQVI